MNFVDKDGTTKVYIPVHPCFSELCKLLPSSWVVSSQSDFVLNIPPVYQLCKMRGEMLT